MNGVWTGLFAFGVLAINAFYSQHSTYIATDTITTSLLCLWIFLISFVKSETSAKNKHFFYALTCMAAGMAISGKYNAVIIMLPTLLVPFWDKKLLNDKHWIITVVRAGLFSLLGFILTSPFFIFDFLQFTSNMLYEFSHYTRMGHEGAQSAPYWSRMYKDIVFLNDNFTFKGMGGWFLYLSLPACLILSKMNNKKNDYLPLILLFPLVFQLLMAKTLVSFSRNMLMVIPFISLAFGYILAELISGASQLLDNQKEKTTSRRHCRKSLVCLSFWSTTRERILKL